MSPRRVEPERAEWTDDLRARFDELLDEYRLALRASLQALRELAQHTGQADILREQILAARKD